MKNADDFRSSDNINCEGRKKSNKKIVKTSSNSFKIGKISHRTNYYSSGLNVVAVRAPNGYRVFFSREIKSMEEVALCEIGKQKNKTAWLATFGVNTSEWRTIFGEDKPCDEEEEEDWNFGESDTTKEEWNFGEEVSMNGEEEVV